MGDPLMITPLLTLCSPAGPRARLSILIFHRVLASPDPLFPEELDAARFDAICRWLARWFHVVPLADAVRRLDAGSLPSRALAITFDDGYADNHDIAMPILRRHGLSATFFVSTGFLDGGRMWNDTIIEAVRSSRLEVMDLSKSPVPSESVPDEPLRLPLGDLRQRRQAIEILIGKAKYMLPGDRRQWTTDVARALKAALPDDLMMRTEQVQGLHRAGMTIGGHTVSHPILATLEPEAVRREIEAGRQGLEAAIQAPVTLFAYPNGKPGRDYLPEHPDIVRSAGFQAAVTTEWGAADGQTDRFQLPRFTPWDRAQWRFGLRMAGNLRRSPGPRGTPSTGLVHAGVGSVRADVRR
jgi:peptidoglycan/xylan/chitin deacetylase (PgdA/CDA1 family)